MPKALPELADLFPPNLTYDYLQHGFDSSERAFRPWTAAWMAEAAMLAYADLPVVKAALVPPMAAWGDGHASPTVYSTQCYVLHDDEKAVVVFRGTELLGLHDVLTWTEKLRRVVRDILVDARVDPAPHTGGGRVHAGFLGALDQVWTRVRAHLGTLPPAPRPRSVWFTGHSLGAALATLAADRHARAGGRVAGVYTFGSPAVGDGAFASAYRSLGIPTFRIVHDRDLIARVPPRLPAGIGTVGLPAYQAVGDPYRLTTDGGSLEPGEPEPWQPNVPSLGELLQLTTLSWPQLAGWLLGHTGAGALVDHAPIYYATFLYNLAEQAHG